MEAAKTVHSLVDRPPRPKAPLPLAFETFFRRKKVYFSLVVQPLPPPHPLLEVGSLTEELFVASFTDPDSKIVLLF